LIVEKVAHQVKSGTKHILLTSEDVGAYGSDIKISIIDLLKKIHEIEGDFNLYINFFDPRWLKLHGQALVEILKLGKIKYLQIPLQSGSDSVLNRMRRAYLLKDAIPTIAEIRSQCPSLALTTQMITGFPGETDEEFEATRRVVESDLFDHSDVFPFSLRTGSAAASLPDHLETPVIEKRARLLRKSASASKWRLMLGLGKSPTKQSTRLVPETSSEAAEIVA
jgi:threonylcarbamoyladenosine tRNA methylthiotransferase MtaB